MAMSQVTLSMELEKLTKELLSQDKTLEPATLVAKFLDKYPNCGRSAKDLKPSVKRIRKKILGLEEVRAPSSGNDAAESGGGGC